jgi:nucleoside-diphosphate-sugar epimerase
VGDKQTDPDAANKRFLLLADGPTITWLDVPEAIPDHLGAAAPNVTLQEAPGDEPTPLTIHNDRAKRELGWQPRAAPTTITDTIDSLREVGLLENRR